MDRRILAGSAFVLDVDAMPVFVTVCIRKASVGLRIPYIAAIVKWKATNKTSYPVMFLLRLLRSLTASLRRMEFLTILKIFFGSYY